MMYQLQKILTKKRIRLSICERNSFDGMSNIYLRNILLVTLYNEERNSSLKPVVPTLQPGMTWLLIFEETPQSSLVDTLVTTSLDVLILLAEHRTGSFFLTEVYRSAPTHSVRWQHYGVWSQTQGLQMSRLAMYDRRDLEGVIIKAGIVEQPLNPAIRDGDKILGGSGFQAASWSAVQGSLKFRTEYKIPSDNDWGTLLADKSWTGLMGLLVGEEVESAAISLSITRERLQNVIFSSTINSYKNSMYIRQPSVSDLSWRYFIMPFSSRLWLAMVASMCVTVLTLVFLYLMGERFLPYQEGAEIQTCSTCLLKIIGIFCQQGVLVDLLYTSHRLVYLLTHLVAVVLLAVYSGALYYTLTFKTFDLPLDSLQALLDSRKYKLGVVENSVHYNQFSESTSLLYRQVYQKLIAPELNNLPSTVKEGLQRVCKLDNYVFVSSSVFVNTYLKDLECTVVSLDKIAHKVQSAYPFIKGSPYFRIFNFKLKKLIEGGITKRLIEKDGIKISHTPMENIGSVDIQTIYAIFYLHIMAVCVSFMMLAIEHIFAIFGKNTNILESFHLSQTQ